MVTFNAVSVVLFLALVISESSYSRSLKDWLKPHIIGGETADIKDFQYQVSLRKRGEPYGHGHICGGSILDKLHILTAAHCIGWPQLPHLYYVVANSTTLEWGTAFDVLSLHIHNEYRKSDPFQFDLAVIRLKSPLIFGPGNNIKPISLVPEDEDPTVDTNVVVAGWGRTIPGNTKPELDFSDSLMKLDLKVVDRTACDACLGGSGRITSRLVCAGVDGTLKKDASVGDSGGPLVAKSTGRQIGIVSFGDESLNSLCPGAYTNLANKNVRSFIAKFVNLN